MQALLKKYKKLSPEAKASIWFLICSLMQKGISVITTPIFTRIMDESQYGAFNVYTSWQDILIIFCTLNLAQGVYMQGLVKYDEIKEEFTSSILSLSLTILICFLCLYSALASISQSLSGLTHIQMLAMFLSMAASTTFMIWAREQRVAYKYRKLVFITILVAAIRPTIGIIVVLNARDKVTARIVEMAAVDAIFYFPIFLSIYKKGKVFFDKKIWKYALKFNLPLIPHFLSQTVLNSADRIMIGSMVGKSEAGIYSLAYQISLFVNLFNNALLQSISPWTYRKLKDHRENEIERVGILSLILIGVLDIAFIAFAPELVAIFAPSSYGNAIWVIPPITVSVFFQYMYAMFVDIELYAEKSQFIATATVIGAGANVLLNYVFINLYGYYAAGYTTLFCYMLIAILHYFFMVKICRSEGLQKPIYSFRNILLPSAVLLCVGFLMLFTYNYSVIRYLIIGLILIVLIINRNKIIDVVRMGRNAK